MFCIKEQDSHILAPLASSLHIEEKVKANARQWNESILSAGAINRAKGELKKKKKGTGKDPKRQEVNERNVMTALCSLSSIHGTTNFSSAR